MFTYEKWHWNWRKLVSILKQLFIYIGLSHIHMKKCITSLWMSHSSWIFMSSSYSFWNFFSYMGMSISDFSQEFNKIINNIKNNVIFILILIYLTWISHQHSALTFLPLSYDISYFSQMKASKIPSCSNSIHRVLPSWDNYMRK